MVAEMLGYFLSFAPAHGFVSFSLPCWRPPELFTAVGAVGKDLFDLAAAVRLCAFAFLLLFMLEVPILGLWGRHLTIRCCDISQIWRTRCFTRYGL